MGGVSSVSNHHQFDADSHAVKTPIDMSCADELNVSDARRQVQNYELKALN